MSGIDEGPAGKGGAMDRGVAVSFLAVVDREIAAVEARLVELRDLRAIVGRHIERYMPGDGPIEDAPPPPPRRPSASRPPLADLIAVVLREAGAPTSVADLRGPMRARGYGVGMEDGKMYNSVYYALRRREDLFVRDGWNRWTLTGRGWQFARAVAPPPPDDGPDDARESSP
jgi:hypothetical protein